MTPPSNKRPMEEMATSHDTIPHDELRAAAILAEVYLRIDAAVEYGFIEGGPVINVERCEEVIAEAEAAAAGLAYGEDDIEAAQVQVIAWYLSMPAVEREARQLIQQAWDGV